MGSPETIEIGTMADKKFSELKGDERRYRIESAARTLMDMAKMKREPGLLKAAKQELRRQIAYSTKALKT